jgi:hypothetical protein
MPRHPPTPARDLLRHQVNAAARLAALDGRHPGHWHLHHTALPDGPGDFTPYPAPYYAEHGLWPPGEWLVVLAELVGPDHAQVIAQRGREAGQ